MMNRVIFALPPKANFTWTEGCCCVNDVEIKELIIESNYALGLLQHELSLRLGDIDPQTDVKLNYCCAQLQSNALRINNQGLSFNDLEQLTHQPQALGQQSADRSIELLKLGHTKLQPKSRDGWHREAYDEFLWLVSKLVSPAHALLVKCSFAKSRVTILDLGRRAKLAQYVKQNQGSLFCPALRNKAVELGIPSDDVDSAQYLSSTPHLLPSYTQVHYPLPYSNLERQDHIVINSQNSSISSSSFHEPHNPIDEVFIVANDQAPVILADTENPNASTRQTRCSQPSISIEMAFNKCTHVCFVVPYGSEIFLRIMSGDTESTKELLVHKKASIFDVDPFGLPVLYYGAFYCMKRKGIFAAIAMCAMLAELGADITHTDEVGCTPMDILVESCLVESVKRSDNTALVMLSCYYGKSSTEITESYVLTHGLGEIHKVLLGLHPMGLQLEEYLLSLPPQILVESIDKPDSYGRSPLICAVEHGLHYAVQTLVTFGANVNGFRLGDAKMLTPLHLVFAGPTQEETIHVARTLIENGANVNIRDSDGWTALLVAASWDNYIGMAMLFGAGADMRAQSYYGETVETLSADPEILQRFWWYLSNLPEPT